MNGIEHNEQSTIYEIVNRVLRRNKEFLDMVTRSPGLDPKQLDSEQESVKFVKVDAAVVYGEFDHVRNDYTKTITFTPRLGNTYTSDIFVNPDEQVITVDTIRNRITKMKIRKAYSYIFTGLNDQIIDLDVSYDSGQLLQVPPQVAVIGRQQVTNTTTFNGPRLPAAPAFDVNVALRNITSLLTITQSVSSRATIESADDKKVQYAEQLIFSKRAEDIFRPKAGASGVTEIIRDASSSEVPYTLQQIQLPDPLGSDSINGDELSAHVLFGYIYAQQSNMFLQRMKMTIRGDPWYLDIGTQQISDNTSISNYRDVNYLWLDISSPKPYDANTSHEDSNSGYWPPNTTSNMLSGIYQVLGKYTAKFSRGVYTIDLDLSRVRMTNPLTVGLAPTTPVATESAKFDPSTWY